MEPSTSSEPLQDQTILFRPSKKRKIYRQRASSPSISADAPSPAVPTAVFPGAQTLDELISSTASEDVEGIQVSMAEILRQRKLHRQRVGGVEFRAAPSATQREENAETALEIREEEKEPAQENGGVVRRFARQTGLVGDVDKHMVAYIDSELAKRRQPATSTSISTSAPPPFTKQATTVPLPTASTPSTVTGLPESQPTSLGKLQEIDLGPSTTLQNAQRTASALSPYPIPPAAPKAPKPRIGRDGKPYIPRSRKRRDSDALKRDALVDQVMSENRIEMYEAVPPARSGGAGTGAGAGEDGMGEGEADEAMEEAFRREFMDAVASRQQQQKKPVQVSSGAGGGKKGEEEALKGPKLGGSRSARAAMREAMLKEQKAGKR